MCVCASASVYCAQPRDRNVRAHCRASRPVNKKTKPRTRTTTTITITTITITRANTTPTPITITTTREKMAASLLPASFLYFFFDSFLADLPIFRVPPLKFIKLCFLYSIIIIILIIFKKIYILLLFFEKYFFLNKK